MVVYEVKLCINLSFFNLILTQANKIYFASLEHVLVSQRSFKVPYMLKSNCATNMRSHVRGISSPTLNG